MAQQTLTDIAGMHCPRVPRALSHRYHGLAS
jgi:hypothetical protein